MLSRGPVLYKFDFQQMEAFEIGAWLIAILAFPGPTEVMGREKAAEALCARTLRTADASVAEQWAAAYPTYSAIDEREERRRLRTLERRLERRMLAAKMSLGLFQEGLSGERVDLPTGMARLSLNALSKFVLPESGESDPENLEHRVWRLSRPVVHLAAAVHVGMKAVFGSDQTGVPYPMDNAQLHKAAIELAEIHEAVVLRDPRFGIRADMLIQVREAGMKHQA